MTNGFFLRAVIGICAVVWIGSLALAGTAEPSRKLFLPYSLVVSVAGALLWSFDRWLWSWRALAPFVGRPDLRGTWSGELASEWVDPETNAKLPPIRAFMCISQTATALHLRQFTEESASLSLAASVVRDPDDGFAVASLYCNEPKASVRHRSEMHFGGMRLRVSGKDALEGDCWTDRSTRGQITLQRISREKARGFSEAMGLLS